MPGSLSTCARARGASPTTSWRPRSRGSPGASATRCGSTPPVGSRRPKVCFEVGERPLIAVCDYGIGNLHSAHKALALQGADARLTAEPALIADAAAVVLPGVGAFGACMAALR